jgi:hypothetical protein
MKRRRLERISRRATVLAAEVDARLPVWCTVPPGDVFAAVWLLAVRLERKARKDRKAAKAHRRVMRQARSEVGALIASQDSGPPRPSWLCGAACRSARVTGAWASCPGIPAHELSQDAEAA